MAEYVSHRRKRSYSRSRSRSAQFHAAADSALQLEAVRSPWRIHWPQILYLTLAGVLAGLLVFFFASDRFYVHRVELSGNHLLTEQKIYEAVNVRGWSIFYISPRRIEARIKAAFPCVRSVQVQCQLPSQVIIQVEERAPSIVWEGASGRRYLVDGEGVVIEWANQMENMILIASKQGKDPQPGDQVDADVVATAQELAAILGLRAFEYTRDYGLSVVAPQGYRVHLGIGGNLPVKVANLKSVTQEIERQGLTDVAYVDVRFESRLSYGFGD